MTKIKLTGTVVTGPDVISESGTGVHTIQKFFQFLPDDPIPQRMESFRSRGIGQQMTDGSFHFVPTPQKKSKSIVICKLPHGKLSVTADDCFQLTLKISRTENDNPFKTLLQEAVEALK